MRKVHRREGAQGAQFSRLVVSYLSQTSFSYFKKFFAKKVPLQFECSFFTPNEVSLSFLLVSVTFLFRFIRSVLVISLENTIFTFGSLVVSSLTVFLALFHFSNHLCPRE